MSDYNEVVRFKTEVKPKQDKLFKELADRFFV